MDNYHTKNNSSALSAYKVYNLSVVPEIGLLPGVRNEARRVVIMSIREG
jgi:hypothetical protein